MPELPEVETIVRDLRPNLVGRKLTSVRRSRHELRKKWSPAWPKLLKGRTVEGIERRGKWIVVRLDPEAYLIIHLGMTGQLQVHEAKSSTKSHTHLVIGLDSGKTELRFRDVRRFGSASVLQDADAVASFFLASGLGPEPFDLPGTYWRERLAQTRRSLKAILLDQRVVAGVGNIYADESLFEARLPPWLTGAATSSKDADRLRKAIAVVLTRAIERRGSSIRDYVGGSGARGSFQHEFRVYGRTGEACHRCGVPIVGIRLAGRSTHYCPRCQESA